MQWLIAFVSMQWHANKWHKTFLDLEQDVNLAIQWLRRYFDLLHKSRWRWRPGDIMSALSTLEAPRSRRSKYSLRGPNRGLADLLYFRVIDLMNSNYESSLELMFHISFVLGVIAFWEMVPQILLEVDPTLVLQPEKVQILKKVILHQGCQSLDVLDGSICTCTENPVHNQMAEDFQQRSLGLTEEARAKARANALAIALASALMGVMLNAVTTCNIRD